MNPEPGNLIISFNSPQKLRNTCPAIYIKPAWQLAKYKNAKFYTVQFQAVVIYVYHTVFGFLVVVCGIDHIHRSLYSGYMVQRACNPN